MIAEDGVSVIIVKGAFNSIFYIRWIKLIFFFAFLWALFYLRNASAFSINTFHIFPPSFRILFLNYILSYLLIENISSCCRFSVWIMYSTVFSICITIRSWTFSLTTFKNIMNSLKVDFVFNLLIIRLKAVD